jgi:hypothetical protein
VTPLDIQQLLQSSLETPMRGQPRILLEEIDGDEVIVRILATPEDSRQGPRLASEVLAAVGPETRRFEREEKARHSSTTIPASVEYDGQND